LFQSTLDFIQQQLATNQVFSGGAVLMVGGAVLAYLRNAPQKMCNFLRRQFVMELHITQRDDCFEWMVAWMAAHPYTRDHAMSLSVTSERRNDGPVPIGSTVSHADRTRPQIILSPAKGQHLMSYRGRLIWITREEPAPSAGSSEYSDYRREKMTIYMLTRDRRLGRKLIEEARDFAWPTEDDRVTLYRLNYESWMGFARRQPRPLSSVVLRDGLLDDLIRDAREFLGKRDWYVERGVPYRRGYLLYGPPGTGKSSAVIAIASAIKMHIAILNLMSSGLNDDLLLSALANTPENSLILIEDIDCVFDQQRSSDDDKKNSLTFSGLLNAIDGVCAGEGRLLFVTTNHLDRLDPALIRHGRIDRHELIDYPTAWQAEQMFLRFFPDATAEQQAAFAKCVADDTKVSAAAIQNHLVQFSDDLVMAIDCIDEIRKTAIHIAIEFQEQR